MQADDGYLYPLERAFFYVQKPPLLLVFEEVEAVEFLRPAQGAPRLGSGQGSCVECARACDACRLRPCARVPEAVHACVGIPATRSESSGDVCHAPLQA